MTGIWRGGYAYHTTKIVGIENPDLDTLSENKRAVVTFESSRYGVFHVVFVGGPLIGSMVINVNVGESVKRGMELARFEYGGSAIYSKSFICCLQSLRFQGVRMKFCLHGDTLL